MKKSIIIVLVVTFSLLSLFALPALAKDAKVTITSFVQVDGWPLWYSCIEKNGYTAEAIVNLQAKKSTPPLRGELVLKNGERTMASLKTGAYSLSELQKQIKQFNKVSREINCPAQVELRNISSSSGAYLPALYIKEIKLKN